MTDSPTTRLATDDQTYVLRLLFGFFGAQAMQAFASLGFADHLGDKPRSAEEVAAATDCDAPSTYRLLRLAAVLRLVEAHGDGTFTLAPAGALLASDHPNSLRDIVRFFAGREQWLSWAELDTAVKTGDPTVDQVLGKSFFPYLAEHPERSQVFNSAMTGFTRLDGPGIAAGADLSSFTSIVDVGGGNGALLAACLQANPSLRGELLDSEKGLGEAEAVLQAAGVRDRVTLTAGDFFVSVPQGHDAYMLKSIIHDWDDEKSRLILSTCREAMRPDSTLLVVEPVVADDPAAWSEAPALLMSDLNMLVMTGGKERTASEFEALLSSAGFRLEGIVSCPGTGFQIIRGKPQPQDA
ncbi:O-methyltransferase [Sinosporangium album]|uniref:O-methyltransferase n=1 Tax=Sinosporangium album TaxID=504805 RepID=A0A1G7W0J9_9ACTN|nr:methyltransferase [Sinosporangium album]SDG65378.1 O-methyltransferase [Sinosporangium album]